LNKQLVILSDITILREAIGGLYKISGSAIHPCKTFHPNEWVKLRQYVEPYLERAAPTLAGKPITIDHKQTLSPENKITISYWQDGQVYFEGTVTEQVYQMFMDGTLKRQVSIGVDWAHPGGGVIVGEEGQFIPYAFDFSELSFLTQEMNPGDLESSLQIWEGVLKEAILQDKKQNLKIRQVIAAGQPYDQVSIADQVPQPLKREPFQSQTLASKVRRRLNW
jgi:hypothetical protein